MTTLKTLSGGGGLRNSLRNGLRSEVVQGQSENSRKPRAKAGSEMAKAERPGERGNAEGRKSARSRRMAGASRWRRVTSGRRGHERCAVSVRGGRERARGLGPRSMEALRWLARVEVAGIEPLWCAIAVGWRAGYSHVERLENAGLVERTFDPGGTVVSITAEGRRASPVSPRAGSEVLLTGGAGAESYAWDLDGDGRFDDAVGKVVTASFPAGQRTVAARASTPQGVLTDSRTFTVHA